MNYPIDVARASGAVILGPDVVCDGFVSDATARVQTHIHQDHMTGFDSSKGLQHILLSEATRRLLIAEYNADLPYRSNVVSLPELQSYSCGNSTVTLVSSGHMLGSVQVSVELADGMRVGYSGDFSWPITQVIQVDALVLDSTYGAPDSIREFSQGECEGRFAQLVHQLLALGPVHIKAARGTMERALQVMTDDVGCPIIASQRRCDEAAVYREFGYGIQPLIVYPSEEADAALEDGYYIKVYGTGDQNPVDLQSGSRVQLSALFCRPDTPVVEYADRSFGVAMSNHADFSGTLEYARATNAQYIVTDSVRGSRGYQLANEIRRRLGVEARPSSDTVSREWGSVLL